jgi:hypothetical protein
VKQVGRELGVRYVLEGSVRKSGKRMELMHGREHDRLGRRLCRRKLFHNPALSRNKDAVGQAQNLR